VHGCLGLDVVDDDAAIVLVLNLGGNLAVDDPLEEGLGHLVSGVLSRLPGPVAVTRTRASGPSRKGNVLRELAKEGEQVVVLAPQARRLAPFGAGRRPQVGD